LEFGTEFGEVNPMTPRQQEVVNSSHDMISITAAKIAAEGGDEVMLLCDCTSQIGRGVAERNGQYNSKDGYDVFIYALERETFIDMMVQADVGYTDKGMRERLVKDALWLILFTDQEPRWFRIERPGDRHWTTVNKNRLTGT
jgi:hypothetical protein